MENFVAAGVYTVTVLAVVEMVSQALKVRCYRTRQMAVNRVIRIAGKSVVTALPLLRGADVQEHHQIHEQ